MTTPPNPPDAPKIDSETDSEMDSETEGSVTTESATQPRDAAFWAAQVTTLRVSGTVPSTALQVNNVDGKSAVGPLQGFGQMWQKTYVVKLGADVSPAEVVSVWKKNFAQFWPPRNYFYGPLTGIAPGEVAMLNIAVGGMPLSTGVLVLYADDESFTLMTPQGHVFAGWITFSAYRDNDDVTLAQVQLLIRANDPIYELGLRFGGHGAEDRFWQHTLRSLARNFGVNDAAVVTTRLCVDRRIQWRHARNIWDNAAVRTMLYVVSSPMRLVARLFGRAERVSAQ